MDTGFSICNYEVFGHYNKIRGRKDEIKFTSKYKLKKRIYIIIILEIFLIFFNFNNVYATKNSNKQNNIDFVYVLEAIFGDFPQYLSNLWVTLPNGTWKDMQVSYKYSELLAEGEEGKNNQYTKVSSNLEVEEKKKKRTKVIGNDEEKFSKNTEIPVTSVDLYTMAAGKVPAFDINILTGQKDTTLHPKDSFWTTVRNIIASIIHMIIYLCMGILIITLIWHGVNVVRSTLTPLEQSKHKTGLAVFGKSLLKLIGSVIIMAICIYSSRMFFDYINIENSMEFPIRVIVKGDAGYSFKTTLTGYCKYMSQIANPDLLVNRCIYTFGYCFLAIVNLAMSIIMFLRVIFVMLFSAVGPIIATANAFNNNKVFSLTFKNWVIIYVCLSFIQTFIALIYTAILSIGL